MAENEIKKEEDKHEREREREEPAGGSECTRDAEEDDLLPCGDGMNREMLQLLVCV